MNKIQELRKEKRLTQEQLANALNIKRITITRAEQGHLTIKNAKKIAAFFNVEWSIFFEDKGAKKVRKVKPA